MKMKKLFLSLLLALTSSVTLSAQEMPSIPVDPDVRIGKLDNGLTYYREPCRVLYRPARGLYSGE